VLEPAAMHGGRCAALVFVIAVVACGAPHAAPRYPVPQHAGDLVIDAAQFARFAAAVRRDAEAAVRHRGDAAAKDELFVLAMLDALDDHWPTAVGLLDRIRTVETDPVKAAMTGVSIRVGADARAHGGVSPEAYAAALERQLAALPIDRVRDELAMLRAMGQTFTPDVCRELVEESVGPHVRAGTIGFDDVQTIVFQRYAAVELSPVGAVIDRVLAAHGIGLPGAAP
jgi:hypothetical protein